jgi:hypothetical protein
MGTKKPGESRLRQWAARIPFIDSFISLAQSLGIPKFLLAGIPLVGGAIYSVWGWVSGNVPPVVLVALSLWVAAGIAALTYWVMGAVIRWRGLKNYSMIDKDALAEEAERLSEKIFALLAEFRGPLDLAWEADCRKRTGPRTKQKEVTGRLLEKYGLLYEGEAWRIIDTGQREVDVGDNLLWRLKHGARGADDLHDMALALTRVASQLRYGPAERDYFSRY